MPEITVSSESKLKNKAMGLECRFHLCKTYSQHGGFIKISFFH